MATKEPKEYKSISIDKNTYKRLEDLCTQTMSEWERQGLSVPMELKIPGMIRLMTDFYVQRRGAPKHEATKT